MSDVMDLVLYFYKEIWATITTTNSPFMFVYGLGILVAIIGIILNFTNVKGRR